MIKLKKISIVFFDIDDFKLINDRYGHEAGDEVLVRLIHERVGNHLFVHDQHIRCTFGVVAYKFGDTPKELTRRADRKLYEAKGVDPVGGVKVSDDGGEL